MPMKLNFDAGVSESMKYGECCAPAQPGKPDDKKVYPSFTVVAEEAPDFADEGTMTIRFKTTRRVEEERGGEERCEYQIEVREIVSADVESYTMASSGHEAEDALDAIKKALEAQHEKDETEDEEMEEHMSDKETY